MVLANFGSNLVYHGVEPRINGKLKQLGKILRPTSMDGNVPPFKTTGIMYSWIPC